MGSVLAARKAGTMQARIAVKNNVNVTRMKVTGSNTASPKGVILDRRMPKGTATNSPTDNPTTMNTNFAGAQASHIADNAVEPHTGQEQASGADEGDKQRGKSLSNKDAPYLVGIGSCT
ncbi:MAG: hypothetical protein AMJ65_03580, partial [Phycisphaerae bacterium SG8_4]